MAVAIVFRLGELFCCLFYCFLEGLQANQVRPYESILLLLLLLLQVNRIKAIYQRHSVLLLSLLNF